MATGREAVYCRESQLLYYCSVAPSCDPVTQQDHHLNDMIVVLLMGTLHIPGTSQPNPKSCFLKSDKGVPYLLSQITAFRSKWLVGSSSMSKVGSMNKALWIEQTGFHENMCTSGQNHRWNIPFSTWRERPSFSSLQRTF